MKFALLLALLLPVLVHAQANTAVLSCTAPTQNTDGSNLSATQLPGTYKFYEGTTLGNYPNSSPAQSSCAYTWTGLTAGTHFFVVTFTDKLGATSAQSVSASKVVTNPVPKPPTGLTVAADPTAFEIRPSGATMVAARIGRVEIGTACLPESQTVAGVKYNRVEIKSVDLVNWPTASPNTVKAWARCS